MRRHFAGAGEYPQQVHNITFKVGEIALEVADIAFKVGDNAITVDYIAMQHCVYAVEVGDIAVETGLRAMCGGLCEVGERGRANELGWRAAGEGSHETRRGLRTVHFGW